MTAEVEEDGGVLELEEAVSVAEEFAVTCADRAAVAATLEA
jgi:hypothetical protein